MVLLRSSGVSKLRIVLSCISAARADVVSNTGPVASIVAWNFVKGPHRGSIEFFCSVFCFGIELIEEFQRLQARRAMIRERWEVCAGAGRRMLSGPVSGSYVEDKISPAYQQVRSGTDRARNCLLPPAWCLVGYAG